MKKIAEFQRLLSQKIKDKLVSSVLWATVENVNWEEKTMTVKSLVDDLPYEDVLLGLGSYYRKPKVGSKCLIGIIGSKSAITYLIECDQLEEIEVTTGNSELKITEDGIQLKRNQENLSEVLSDMIDELNKTVSGQKVVNSWNTFAMCYGLARGSAALFSSAKSFYIDAKVHLLKSKKIDPELEKQLQKSIDEAKKCITGPLRDSEWAIYASIACENTVLINKSLYLARCDGQGYSSQPSNAEKHIAQSLIIRKYLYYASSELQALSQYFGAFKSSFAKNHMDAAYWYLNDGQIGKAFKHFFSSVKITKDLRKTTFLVRILLCSLRRFVGFGKKDRRR